MIFPGNVTCYGPRISIAATRSHTWPAPCQRVVSQNADSVPDGRAKIEWEVRAPRVGTYPSTPKHRCDLVLLPTFDRGTVCKEAVEVIDAEDAYETQRRHTGGKVEYEEDHGAVACRWTPLTTEIDPPVVECEERESDKVHAAAYIDEEEKAKEGSVVAIPHAIGYPGAVMVHSKHTSSARLAVVCPRRFVRFALGAVPPFARLTYISRDLLFTSFIPLVIPLFLLS